jgi:hypothetical protein
MPLGPDAARYIAASQGTPVPRPFNLRWALPIVCRNEVVRWWVVYVASFVTLGVAVFVWRLVADDSWQVAAAVAVLVVGLPGILGPSVSVPVQVDLPSTALVAVSLIGFETGTPLGIALGVTVVAVAATVRETAPVVAALWTWTLWPLLALPVVALAWWRFKPGPDPLGPRFQNIADHPIHTAFEHHRGQWRNGWIMVAPWGVCLAALYEPDWRLVVVLAVAYAQLLVATDSVRLYQHVACVPMAVAAAQVIPVAWLPLAAVLHVAWFRTPERI